MCVLFADLTTFDPKMGVPESGQTTRARPFASLTTKEEKIKGAVSRGEVDKREQGKRKREVERIIDGRERWGGGGKHKGRRDKVKEALNEDLLSASDLK